MTIVITMAGLGSRFRQAGYNVPKFMIEVKGKSLFEWSMESLEDLIDETTDVIFIVRKECQAREFICSKCLKMAIKRYEIIEIDYLTDGQATTAYLGAQKWNKESELMIYNIDTYVEKGEILKEKIVGDGYIPCFVAPGEHWSFVKTDEKGNAVEVAEKRRISENCTLGAYYFKTCELYEKLYNEYYEDKSNLLNGEKYIAPLYNLMIKLGYMVRISLIEREKIHVLGTPEELMEFAGEEKNE